MGALQVLFTNRKIRGFLGKTRYLLALMLLVPLAWGMQPRWLPAGVAISMLGQLIQGWCFASLVKNLELSVRGPYLLVRNPMYLGRYFMILGFVWLLGSPLAVGIYTVLYAPYAYYRVLGEERRLRRAFGEQFERYCREVNRFLPTPGGMRKPELWFFDMRMFLNNNGHWNILLTLIGFAAVWGLHSVAV